MFQKYNQHIYPIFERATSRQAKGNMLQQRAKVIWLTGLFGPGNTTLTLALESRLFRMGYFSQVLDGYNFHAGINAPFEKPISPDSCIDTSKESPKQSIQKIIDLIFPEITL